MTNLVFVVLVWVSQTLFAMDDFYTPKEDLESLRRSHFDESLPNVLIIGDSISIGYTQAVVELLEGSANVSRPIGDPLVNCGDTVKGIRDLSNWVGDVDWDVIHFNWGLHDLCYRHPDAEVYGKRDKVNGSISVPLEEYEANLELLLKKLRQTGASLVWASTTVVPDDEAGRFVGDEVSYNAVASHLMMENGIVINDLHELTASFDGAFFVKPGDVHFTKAGYELLGAKVASSIMAELTKRSEAHELSSGSNDI